MIVLILSLSGPLVCRALSRKFVLAGVRTIDSKLRALYARALDVAKDGLNKPRTKWTSRHPCSFA